MSVTSSVAAARAAFADMKELEESKRAPGPTAGVKHRSKRVKKSPETQARNANLCSAIYDNDDHTDQTFVAEPSVADTATTLTHTITIPDHVMDADTDADEDDNTLADKSYGIKILKVPTDDESGDAGKEVPPLGVPMMVQFVSSEDGLPIGDPAQLEDLVGFLNDTCADGDGSSVASGSTVRNPDDQVALAVQRFAGPNPPKLKKAPTGTVGGYLVEIPEEKLYKEEDYRKWLWNKGYNELKAYEAEFGDCLVPQSHVVRKGNGSLFKLGKWVHNQRQNYRIRTKTGNKIRMTDERMRKLNEINFVWDKLEAEWGESYNELKAYEAEFGDCLVPLRCEVRKGNGSLFKLGLWVHTQRQNYRIRTKTGNKVRMTDERMMKLNEINFVWDKLEAEWGESYNELKAYEAEFGDCLVSQSHVVRKDDGSLVKLGKWVNNQRQSYRIRTKTGNKIRMTDERMRKLNEINFVWDVLEAEWGESYNELKAYKDKFGDCLVPNRCEVRKGNGSLFKLGQWVSTQRGQHRKNRMTDERMAKLEAVGFAWSVP